jgi:hypothetical protein
MEVGTTELAIIGLALGGAFKALDWAFKIIMILINKRGNNEKLEDIEPESTQVLLEKFIERIDFQKVNKELCDERSGHIVSRLGGIDGRLEKGGEQMSAMQSDIAAILKTVNGGGK